MHAMGGLGGVRLSILLVFLQGERFPQCYASLCHGRGTQAMVQACWAHIRTMHWHGAAAGGNGVYRLCWWACALVENAAWVFTGCVGGRGAHTFQLSQITDHIIHNYPLLLEFECLHLAPFKGWEKGANPHFPPDLAMDATGAVG